MVYLNIVVMLFNKTSIIYFNELVVVVMTCHSSCMWAYIHVQCYINMYNYVHSFNINGLDRVGTFLWMKKNQMLF